MMRVIVNGALGRMGGILVNLIEGSEDACVAAAADSRSGGGAVLNRLEDFAGEADVLIDFSAHTSAPGLLAYARARSLPAVIATTGHDEGEKAAIRAAAEQIPVFWSANMSMGIAFLAQTAKKAAALFPDADIEIVEAHHDRKADAPSGTALLLADAIREARPDAVNVPGRTGYGVRKKNDIGISSLRLGNLAGTHEIIIATDTQSITLRHDVYDRALFAEGAMDAARFLVGKPAGLYDMGDLVK